MFDLEKEITDQFAKMNASGVLAEIIEKKMAQAIDDSICSAIEQVFGWNGAGNKKIEEVINKSLDFDVAQLKIPSYREALLTIIKDKLNEVTFKDMGIAVKKIDDLITEELPETISFSDLMDKFIEFVKEEDEDEHEGEVSISVDSERTTLAFMGFDKEADKERHQCEYGLVLHTDGKIHSFEFDGKAHQTKYAFGKCCRYGFADYVYKLYVNGIKIVDIDDCDIEDIKHWQRDEY